MMQRLMWILWPAFLVAGIGTAVFFTVFDPVELRFFGDVVESASRTAVYSLGFFLFWALAAASSALTCYLQRSSAEVNRLEAAGRRPTNEAHRSGHGGSP
jgi:E3 ubiquitin-protein ligase DOA10